MNFPLNVLYARHVIMDTYSSLEIGYDKGGDYEEAFGLDEYNGTSKFTTIITRVKNVFIRKSKTT